MKMGVTENDEERVVSFESNIDTIKCLMLLSPAGKRSKRKLDHQDEDVFECKTCHRQFPSFQALGGHRAGHHKKARLIIMGDHENQKAKVDGSKLVLSLAITKPSVHQCAICGKKFGMGQALGGHMRKHRASIYESFAAAAPDHNYFPVVSKVPELSRSNSSKRVLCLDLNLTPLENDFEGLSGNMAPKLDLRFPY